MLRTSQWLPKGYTESIRTQVPKLSNMCGLKSKGSKKGKEEESKASRKPGESESRERNIFPERRSHWLNQTLQRSKVRCRKRRCPWTR